VLQPIREAFEQALSIVRAIRTALLVFEYVVPDDPVPQCQADVDRFACLGGTVLVNLPDCLNEPGEVQLLTLVCHC
jgi:hypothetical protein